MRHYPGAVILVSHDRMFLDHVVDEIVEIEFGKTMRFPGSYSHYVKAKEEYIERNHDAFVRQQEEIARISALIEKFRYKKTRRLSPNPKSSIWTGWKKSRMSKRIKARSKPASPADAKAETRFGSRPPANRLHRSACEVDLLVMKGDRLGIVGPNGIGKSTFIKTLVEKLPALGGSFHFGHQIDLGYFDQDSAQITSSQTVLDTLWDAYPQTDQTQLRNTLASFLFTQDEVFKEVYNLSGGEKVRLALACLMLAHDNVLLLDEPTNHLDIPAKEALEKALEAYDGTILFVSHDRMFLKKMANRIMEMGATSKVYNVGYEEYLEKKAQHTLVEAAREAVAAPAPIKQEKLSFNESKALKNRVAKLEKLLEEAEVDLEALRELRFEPEYYQDYRKMEELDAQIDEKHNEIAAYTKEWEEKMEKLEGEAS